MAFFFLDLIFPKRCVSCGNFGSYICKECFKKIEYVKKPICPICQRQSIGGRTHPKCQKPHSLNGLVVAARYKGPIKLAIQKVKYRWVFDIQRVLSDILAENFWRFDLPQKIIMVPVPLHPKRQRQRGFNQAEILAKNLSKEFNHPCYDLLSRDTETKSQVGLSKKERKTNVKGAFSLSANIAKCQISGKSFLLVDDVYTSGATMQEASKVLKRAGASEVWAMAIALG